MEWTVIRTANIVRFNVLIFSFWKVKVYTSSLRRNLTITDEFYWIQLNALKMKRSLLTAMQSAEGLSHKGV